MPDEMPNSELSIMSREDLRDFLEGRPAIDAWDIALRVAWRAVPYIRNDIGFGDDEELGRRLTLALFRAALLAQHGRSAMSVVQSTGAIGRTLAEALVRTSNAYAANEAAAYAANSAAKAAICAGVLPDTGVDAGGAIDLTISAAYAAADAAEEEGSLIWKSIEGDCRVTLSGFGPLTAGGVPLWSTPGSQERARAENQELRNVLSSFGPDWTLISHWYGQIIENASIDPFPNKKLDEIANKPGQFWGDGNDNNRTPDDVMAEIAEILGWSPAAEDKIEPIPSPDNLARQSGRVVKFTETPGEPVDIFDHLSSDGLDEKLEADLRDFAQRVCTSGGNLFGQYVETLSEYQDALGMVQSDERSHRIWKLGNRMRRAVGRESTKLERLRKSGPEDALLLQEEVVEGLLEFRASHNAYTAGIEYCANLDANMGDPALRADQRAILDATQPLIEQMDKTIATDRARQLLANEIIISEEPSLNEDQGVEVQARVSSNFFIAFLRKTLVEAKTGIVGGTAFAGAVWVAKQAALFERLVEVGAISEEFLAVVQFLARLGYRLMN